MADARRSGLSLAFRVGGGNFLGVRLQIGATIKVRGVWRVTSVPLSWSSPDAQWTEIEVLSPPQSRKQPWLVRGTPPASVSGAFGAAQVGSDVIMLQRATQRKPKEASVNRLSAAPARPSAQH